MKKILCLLAVIVLIMTTKAQNAVDVPFMTRSFANSSFQKVLSETSGGNIKIKSVPASEARVEVFVFPSNYRERNEISKEELQKRLEDYDLKVSVEGNTLTAIAKSKKSNMDWKKSVSISFHIYAPREISTDLRTSGGNIELLSLSGQQVFTTSGGNLNITDVKGSLRGRTSGGNIKVSSCDNKIDLTTSGGNIVADKCAGTIKLETSGGSVGITNLNGTIEANTSGGNVTGSDIKGELEAHTSGGNVGLKDLYCSIEASTSGGNISVSVRELGKFVRLSNSGGDISLDIPASKGIDLTLKGDRVNSNKLDNFSGKIEEDEINGKLNGGGTPVTVKASSGRVVLTVK